MKIKQYTIRNIPPHVDTYLRKKAKLSGRSLNQTIIEELSEKVAEPGESLISSLDWFIGSGIDDETLRALEEEDREQKEIARREMGL